MKLIARFKNEFKSEFARNFLILFTGTGFSQVIPILAAPILTRLYTPEEFGLLALFTSTGLFMGNIATLQYDSAIMLPKREKDAINIMALSILSVLAMTILTLFIVVVFNGSLKRLIGSEKMGFWLYLVPLSVFLTGLFRTLNIWASRMRQFKRLAVRNIMQSSTTAGTKLGIGFFTKINGGLIIGSLAGQFTATSVLLYQTLRKDGVKFSIISIKRISFNAKKYKEFPLYANFQGFLDMFKETGVQYIISNFYGTAILGVYSFTLGLLQKPAQLIGGAISQVYFQKAADTFNAKGDLWGLTKKIMIRLLALSTIIYLPIFFFGQVIFSFVFGDKWEMAGLYAQILTPWLISSFLIQFSTRIPQIVNKQKSFFKISTLFNVLFFSTVLILSIIRIDFIYVLISMTSLMVVLIMYLLFWFKKIVTTQQESVLDQPDLLKP
jgi:O-antigen/teichoic acid export membrane protein